jgi:hypothetical protein
VKNWVSAPLGAQKAYLLFAHSSARTALAVGVGRIDVQNKVRSWFCKVIRFSLALAHRLDATKIRIDPNLLQPGNLMINHGKSVYSILRHTIITLWLFNIAMENGPFIDDSPIKTSIYKGFSMAMLVITRG